MNNKVGCYTRVRMYVYYNICFRLKEELICEIAFSSVDEEKRCSKTDDYRRSDRLKISNKRMFLRVKSISTFC